MTLKAELREAILTGGAEGAAPLQQAISLGSGGSVGETWQQITSVIAPATGVIFFHGKSSSDLGVAIISNLIRSSGMCWFKGGLQFDIALDVRKGDAISISGNCFESWSVYMQKIVGGGGRRLKFPANLPFFTEVRHAA